MSKSMIKEVTSNFHFQFPQTQLKKRETKMEYDHDTTQTLIFTSTKQSQYFLYTLVENTHFGALNF